jgi:predicted nucleotidyltransferase
MAAGRIANDERLRAIAARQPYPLLFVTVSGAHLYGFPSPDSDYDLRGVHVLPVREVVQREYNRLQRDLEEAHHASILPDVPSARPVLNDLLVRLRLQQSGVTSHP